MLFIYHKHVQLSNIGRMFINDSNKQEIIITSKWYIEYTLNMLFSLNELNLSNIVNVYCLDNESYEQINERGFNGKKLILNIKLQHHQRNLNLRV